MELHSFKLRLTTKRVLDFIPAPFLPSPGSFITYDETAKLVFTGALFSHFTETSSSVSTGVLLKEYHEKFLPSSDFIRPIISKIVRKPIEYILPAYGNAIFADNVQVALDVLRSLEFYNSNLVVQRVAVKNREYNHEILVNQVLAKLVTAYGLHAVIHFFQNTDIRLNPISGELSQHELTGYRLWNRVFDLIFLAKGQEGLILLEAMVNKFVKLYNVKKPPIYRSRMATTIQKLEALGDEKAVLETEITSLKSNLTQVNDQNSRDPLTGFLNEESARLYIAALIQKNAPSAADVGMLYIEVENIKQINSMHSKETGDETLRNLGYLIADIKSPSVAVFKRNGPGFVCVHDNPSIDELTQCVKGLRQAVAEAEVFVEPVDVTIGGIRLSEISEAEINGAPVDAMFRQAEKRLGLARKKGGFLVTADFDREIAMQSGKVLLIDADEIAERLFRTAFAIENFDVIVAKDGLDGLKKLEEHQIDAIIAERMLVKLDGLGVKTRLNQMPGYDSIPFILTTFQKNQELILRANRLKIDFVVQKPLIVDEIVGIVLRMTEKKANRP
jgi:diguanylate cyclase (GGDEF)-like protein